MGVNQSWVWPITVDNVNECKQWAHKHEYKNTARSYEHSILWSSTSWLTSVQICILSKLASIFFLFGYIVKSVPFGGGAVFAFKKGVEFESFEIFLRQEWIPCTASVRQRSKIQRGSSYCNGGGSRARVDSCYCSETNRVFCSGHLETTLSPRNSQSV